MDIIRLNKQTGERTIVCYSNSLSEMENLVSDVIDANKMNSQLLNKETRKKIAATVLNGNGYLTAESAKYDHLVYLNE